MRKLLLILGNVPWSKIAKMKYVKEMSAEYKWLALVVILLLMALGVLGEDALDWFGAL